MFWKFGFHTPSAIDGILARDDFTLEELLDDDDVLQECRNQNQKLTEFLSTPEIVKQLLDYVTKEPAGAIDDRQRFKFPNVASEILTTDTQGIMQVVCQEDSLDQIWGMLDAPAPMNPLLASYFSKIVCMLLNKQTNLVTEYLYTNKGEWFNKLISHLGTSAVMDLVRRMTTVDAGADGVQLMQWLAGTKQLVAVLVGLFDVADSGADRTILTNATILMQDLISDGRKEAIDLQEIASPSPFLNQLVSEEFLGVLLENVLSKGSDLALDRGLPVLLTLLDDPVRGEDEAPPTDTDEQRHKEEVKMIMATLVPRLKEMHALLVEKDAEVDQARLGAIRLNAVRAIEAILSASYFEVEEELVAAGAVQTILKLYGYFPENNFLHKHTADIVKHIMDHPPTEVYAAPLFKSLFVDCNVLQFIIDQYMKSEAAEALPKGRRAGYMGHLVVAANTINAVIDRGDDSNPMDKYFAAGSDGQPTRDKWAEFREVHLDALRKKWRAELGGKPPRMTMGDSDEDDDMDDASYLGEDMSQGADHAYDSYRNQQAGMDLNDFNIDDDDSDNSDNSDDDDAYGSGAVELDDGEDGGTASISRFGKTGMMADFSNPISAADLEGGNDWQIGAPGAEGAAAPVEGGGSATVDLTARMGSDAILANAEAADGDELGGDDDNHSSDEETQAAVAAAAAPEEAAGAGGDDAEPAATSTPLDANAPAAPFAEDPFGPSAAAATAEAEAEAEAAPADPFASPAAAAAVAAGDAATAAVAATESSTDPEDPFAAPPAAAAAAAPPAGGSVDIEGGAGVFNSSA